MNDQFSVRYFKRDKLTCFNNSEGTEVENLEVVFQITDGIILSVIKRPLYRNAFMFSSGGMNFPNNELKAELQWLALNQRGIFRLLALSLKPHAKTYPHIVTMANEHGITI